MDPPPRSGDEFLNLKQRDDFQYLPARSRTPLYIPHGMEIALPASTAPYEQTTPPATATTTAAGSAEFWKPCDRFNLTSAAEVSITNNTTVLVVDVPLKPIEKLKRAVKKMQRASRKEAVPRGRNDINLSRSASARTAGLGHQQLSRYDGGRSSLRMDKGKRGLNSETTPVDNKTSDMDSMQLLRENLDLKQRLEEDETNFRRKIDTYRLAQQHQATLVSRLQTKVLQYKKRCSDLENQIKDNLPLMDSVKQFRSVSGPPGSALDAAQQHLRGIQEEPILDFDQALKKLNEEQCRNEKLTKLNIALQEQLEECQQTNEALTNDLQKLAGDWQQMRDEMLEKEEEWKEEEQFFNEYYNTEHSRMLDLWKDIVSMKRSFSEIQSSTHRDLSKLRNDISSTSNDMMAMCSGLLTSGTHSVAANKQQELKKHNFELQNQINKLKIDYDNTITQLKQKDDKVNQLSKEIQTLTKKLSDTEDNLQEISQLQEEVKLLFNGISEIAQTVVNDADSRDIENIQMLPHLHLSSIVGTPARSSSDNVLRVHTAATFVENTISGLQALLYRYQSQIHELQVKITSLSEQLISADKQNENFLDTHRKLADKIDEQNEELDSLKAELNLLMQEKESLVKALDSTRSEKQIVEKSRTEISDMLANVNLDYEKILKTNNRLQKIVLSVEDDKNFLQSEIDRFTKELESRELSNRLTEDRCSQMLDELLTVKEDLNKERLDKELMEQNRAEAQSLLSYMEKTKNEIECELQRVLNERSEMHEALTKTESYAANLEDEKKKLQEELVKMEEIKMKLQQQLSELNSDLEAVRKELLHTEQNRLDLETEKIALQEKCKFAEEEKQKVDLDLTSITRERNELNEQLLNTQRKKEALNEELMRLRYRIEQVGETNARVNKHLEDLVKECEEKQIILESNEKEIIRLQEINAVLKTDKQSLEAALFEIQNNLEASEMKRETMDKDIQELLTRQNILKVDITKREDELENLRKQFDETKANLMLQLKNLEIGNKQQIADIKAQQEELCRRLEEEKEQLKITNEKKMQTALTELENEKIEEINQLKKKMDILKQQIDTQNQQYEEALRRAENDKQQALLLAHQDQKAVLEKMETMRSELEEEKSAFEKLRRESNLKAEQDRSNINTLRDQVTRLTSKIDDMRIKTEEEKQKLEIEMEELKKEKDCCIKEYNEMKVELSLSEDRLEGIKSQLGDTNHKLKETEKNFDYMKRELNDVRRQLSECSIEKDKYLTSNKELRDFIKKSEAEKREQARSLEEAYQKINGQEDRVCQLEDEKKRLQNAYREIEFKILQSNQNIQSLQQELEKSNAINLQKQNDEKEILNKLNLEIDEKENLQQELHVYKKQLFESERTIDANEQELLKLRQHIRDEEEQWQMKEQELLSRLEDSRMKERKLEDQKHNLELCLSDSNQQIQELKSRIGGSEGRVRALDTQLSQMESNKKDLENRLKAIGNIFKRLNVLQQEGSITTPLRMLVPARRWSPSRVSQEGIIDSGRTDNAYEVNPENIKKNVLSLLQQMAQLERERDDLQMQNANVKKQLDETYETQNKNDTKVNSMAQTIRQLNEEKEILEIELCQKETSLLNESAMLKQKIEQVQQLKDKNATLELSLLSRSEDKQQTEERLVKFRNEINQLENEKQKLKENLTKAESKSARLEIQRIALEGDLNRLQMMLQEKDIQLQKTQDRLENYCKTVTNLEEKCDSLQSSIDQLNSSIEIANSVENDLRAEIQSLQKSLSDCSLSSQSYNERIKQLQKTLNNNENERRLLVERLDRADRTLNDLQAECKARIDQINTLQSELNAKEIQRVHLEDQLRYSKYSSTSPVVDEKDTAYIVHKLQIECNELRGKIEILEEKLRRVDTEKKMLEKKLNCADRKICRDKIESGDTLQSDYGLLSTFNFSYLEHENKDLKQKCNSLETQLAEKEAELLHLRNKEFSRNIYRDRNEDIERLRAGQLRAEHLLKAREQSHKQQIIHLKNEINNLRRRLDQEMKLKRRYFLESSNDSVRIKHLRETLADSLRTISQNPTLDALLLDHETKKLNSSLHLLKSDDTKPMLSSIRK